MRPVRGPGASRGRDSGWVACFLRFLAVVAAKAAGVPAAGRGVDGGSGRFDIGS